MSSGNAPFPIDGSRDALWMTTAAPAVDTVRLRSPETCDVAIVGAGLTGLNAALELALNGVSVTVLDAATVGYGASGRSGGQVNLGLNSTPAQLIKRFGCRQAEKLIDLIMNTPQSVFDLIRQHSLDCDPVQNGWVQAAASARIWQSQKTMVTEYKKFGNAFQVLDADQLAERSGAAGYSGGLFCEVAGSVQPLSYTRELARVAIKRGANIYSNSAVTGIERMGDNWILNAGDASLTARTVLICTNGYSQPDIGKPLSKLARTVVPVRSVLVASEPLSDDLRDSILPGQVTFVDKRRLILYMRYDRDGRLCVGDHGPMRDAFRTEDFNAVKQRALKVFPQLRSTRWDFHWGGRIAITKSGLPFMHEIAPGLVAGMGFNGRGVGMGSMMGRELARYAIKSDRKTVSMPVTAPSAFALHRFHGVGVSMSIKWYALMDHLDSLK